MLVLFNWAVFLTLCVGKICQKIFFGPLRAVEIEHLHERLWYAITESLLAMTIFRDDFDGSFVLLFGTMLFLKVFHWLAQDTLEGKRHQRVQGYSGRLQVYYGYCYRRR